MAVRIIGSAFASSPAEVVALKMLHALEVPLIFVGMFKYIEDVFDTRLSATIYMMGFIFAKGIGVSSFLPWPGMYTGPSASGKGICSWAAWPCCSPSFRSSPSIGASINVPRRRALPRAAQP